MNRPSNDPDELEGVTLHRLSVKPSDGGWLDLYLLDFDREARGRWYVRILRSAEGEPRRTITRRDVAAMRRQRRPRGTRELLDLLEKSGIYTEELAAELCDFALSGRRRTEDDEVDPLDRLASATIGDCPGRWRPILSRSGQDQYGGYSSRIYARKCPHRPDGWDLVHLHDDGTLQRDSFKHAGDITTLGDAVRSKYGFGEDSEACET